MKIFHLFYSLLILLLLFSLNIYANNVFYSFCGWPHMMIWKWGGMCIGLLFLVFIGLIVYLIVKGAKATSTEVSHKENNTLKILNERYAGGEVNKEEYDRIKKDLQDDKCEKEDYIILCFIKNIIKYLVPLGLIEIFHHIYVSVK